MTIFSKVFSFFKEGNKEEIFQDIPQSVIENQLKPKPKVVFYKFKNKSDVETVLSILSDNASTVLVETIIQNQLDTLKDFVSRIKEKGYRVTGFGTKWLLITPANIEVKNAYGDEPKKQENTENLKNPSLEVYDLSNAK